MRVDDLGLSHVSMGEPCLVNPNSYATINQVLRHIQNQTSMDRAWSVAGADGVPYVLGHRLHDKNDSLKNMLLLPGPGHVEINVIRVLCQLLWPLGMEDLAKIIGFKTLKALSFAPPQQKKTTTTKNKNKQTNKQTKKPADHHKVGDANHLFQAPPPHTHTPTSLWGPIEMIANQRAYW